MKKFIKKIQKEKLKKKKKNKLQKNKEKKREDTLQWILNKNNKVCRI